METREKSRLRFFCFLSLGGLHFSGAHHVTRTRGRATKVNESPCPGGAHSPPGVRCIVKSCFSHSYCKRG